MSNGVVPGDGGSSGVGATRPTTGPCGACKFLRRKCVKGCIFAPYFESDQLGTAHFAAVHKVFGASNASKLLLRIPPHKRLDAVVSLCYEALARVRDPTYGCVAHIFTLQQHVVNLQAELAYTQARLSTLRSLPPVPPHQLNDCLLPHQQQEQPGMAGSASFCNLPIDQEELDDAELQALAREFVTRYLTGVRFRPSNE